MQVLKSKSEIVRARQELRRRGLSCTSTAFVQFFRRAGFKSGLYRRVSVGDTIKSWDVLRAAEFIEQNIPSNLPILDVGAYASEIICVLHRLNYSALTGVDLNPQIKFMPYANRIRYAVADFMRTPFPAESFAAITAISVIEHGFQSQNLLSEISRLLRPGGYFLASFDYWHEKIDTHGIQIFGMDWKIFSKAEVLDFLAESEWYALHPCGALDFTTQEQTMEWGGKRYTFAWLALQKTPTCRF